MEGRGDQSRRPSRLPEIGPNLFLSEQNQNIQHSEGQGQGGAEVRGWDMVGTIMRIWQTEDFSFHALEADASFPTSCREFPWAKNQQTLEESVWKLVPLVSVSGVRSASPPLSQEIKTGWMNSPEVFT